MTSIDDIVIGIFVLGTVNFQAGQFRMNTKSSVLYWRDTLQIEQNDHLTRYTLQGEFFLFRPQIYRRFL